MRDFIRFILYLYTFRFICLIVHRHFKTTDHKEKAKKLNRFDFIRFAIENEEKAQSINLPLFNLIEFLSKRKKENESKYCCWPNFPLLLLPDKCREKQPFTISQTKNYDNPFI